MYLIEINGEFDTQEEVLDLIQSIVDRLIFDADTGEILGILPEGEEGEFRDCLSEIEVEVPEEIIAWAKKEAATEEG